MISRHKMVQSSNKRRLLKVNRLQSKHKSERNRREMIPVSCWQWLRGRSQVICHGCVVQSDKRATGWTTASLSSTSRSNDTTVTRSRWAHGKKQLVQNILRHPEQYHPSRLHLYAIYYRPRGGVIHSVSFHISMSYYNTIAPYAIHITPPHSIWCNLAARGAASPCYLIIKRYPTLSWVDT